MLPNRSSENRLWVLGVSTKQTGERELTNYKKYLSKEKTAFFTVESSALYKALNSTQKRSLIFFVENKEGPKSLVKVERRLFS